MENVHDLQTDSAQKEECISLSVGPSVGPCVMPSQLSLKIASQAVENHPHLCAATTAITNTITSLRCFSCTINFVIDICFHNLAHVSSQLFRK